MKDTIERIMESAWVKRGLMASIAFFPLYMGIAILVLPWTHQPGFSVVSFAILRSVSAVVGVIMTIIGGGLMYGALTGDLKVREPPSEEA